MWVTVTIIQGADAYRHTGMQIDQHTGRAHGEREFVRKEAGGM